MASSNQSQLQTFIEQMTGTNANAQTAQPNNPNNGNPNTVNNVPPGQPNPNLTVLPAQMDARGNWWTPPNQSLNTSGLIAGLPQVSNPNIGNILGNLTRPPAGTNPNPGTGPGTPGPGPGTPNPPTTPGPGPSGPGMGGPIGPISGPIHNNPTDIANNYNNAQPNTNAIENGYGREGTLEWLRNNYGSSGHINPPSWLVQSGELDPSREGTAGNKIVNWFKGLASRLGSEVRGEWNEFVDDITLQNGVGGLVSQLGRFFGIPDNATDAFFNLFTREEPLDNAQIREMADNAIDRMLNQSSPNYDATIARINSRMEELVTRSNFDIQQLYQQFYDSHPEATPQQWQDMMESIQWNNFWNGNLEFMDTNGGVRQNRVGLRAMDFIDQMLNQMANNATNWTEAHRDRFTRER